MQKNSKYLIAFLPPPAIQEEINAFQKEIVENIDCKYHQNISPHLTLIMPFIWKKKKEKILFDLINRINHSFNPFDIQIKNFDFFEPKLIFCVVEKDSKLMQFQSELLKIIRKELKIPHTNYKNGAFHPHITIGAKGLKKKDFYVIKEIFKDKKYSKCFVVNEVFLIEKNGDKWEKVLIAQS